jgi:hypothetical protein
MFAVEEKSTKRLFSLEVTVQQHHPGELLLKAPHQISPAKPDPSRHNCCTEVSLPSSLWAPLAKHNAPLLHRTSGAITSESSHTATAPRFLKPKWRSGQLPTTVLVVSRYCLMSIHSTGTLCIWSFIVMAVSKDTNTAQWAFPFQQKKLNTGRK